jgi:AraC-like DNA-binding protein
VLRRAQARVGDPSARDRVSDIAFQTGLSTRQFKRRFREYTGVAPIVFSRIARFQKALRLKRSPRFPSWIAIAHTLGYHDQMHTTRDFYGLAGDSPGRAIVQASPEHIMSALTQEEPKCGEMAWPPPLLCRPVDRLPDYKGAENLPSDSAIRRSVMPANAKRHQRSQAPALSVYGFSLVWSVIQFVSHVFPPSAENACSKWGDFELRPVQTNLA